jgi:hypothetical protein
MRDAGTGYRDRVVVLDADAVGLVTSRATSGQIQPMGAAAARRALSLPSWEQSAQQFFTILWKLP